MDNKRLYKSSVNYMLCGVCGGAAYGLRVHRLSGNEHAA